MRRLSIIALLILLAPTAWLLLRKSNVSSPPGVLSEPPKDLPPSHPTLGDEILAAYGSPSSTGEEDLQLFHNYLTNVFILIKKRDTRQYSTNEDLAEFLLGKNSYKTPYLSAGSSILNAEQQLIDRWNSPLRVHPVSSKTLEIRSAGPDKKYFTKDDITLPRESTP